MYTLILSVIAALVVSAEAHDLLKISKGCEELQECMKPLFNNSFGYRSMIIDIIKALSSKDKYNELCKRDDELHSCFFAKRMQCKNAVQDSVLSAAKLVNYICSPRGREGLKKNADSVCLTNETVRQLVEDRVLQCFETYQYRLKMTIYSIRHNTEEIDFCYYHGELSDCVMESFANQCDEGLVTFMKSIERTALDHLVRGCVRKHKTGNATAKMTTHGCDAFENCTRPLYNANDETYEGGFRLLVNEQQLSELCQITGEFQKCYDENKAGCKDADLLFGVARSSQFLKSLCSKEVMEGLQKLKHTPCFADQAVQLATQAGVSNCAKNFKLDTLMAIYKFDDAVEDMCRLEDQQGRCVQAALINNCGDELTSLADQLWNFTVASRNNAKCVSRSSLSLQGCDEVLSCVRPLYTYGFDATYVGSLSVLSNRTKHHELCQKSSDFQSCYADKKDKCKSKTFLAAMSSSAEMLVYLCSNVIKEGVQLMTDSQCVTNQAAFLAAEADVQECVKTYENRYARELNPDNLDTAGIAYYHICAHLGEIGLLYCIADRVKSHCGESFSYVAKDLRVIANRPLSSKYGCDRMHRKIPKGCDALVNCMTPLHIAGFDETFEGSVGLLSDKPKLNALCKLSAEFQSCYVDKKVECKEERALTRHSHLAHMLDYLCSEKGKEDVERLANSPCVTNATVLFGSRPGVEECKRNFDRNVDVIQYYSYTAGDDPQSINVCPLLGQEKECIIASLANDCGENFAQVGKKLWNMQHLARNNELRCDEQFRPVSEVASGTRFSEGCVHLIQCLMPLMKDGFQAAGDFIQKISLLFNQASYDEICDDYDKFHCCYIVKRQTCNSTNIVSLVNGTVDLLGHLCSSKGRKGLKKISASKCVRNKKVHDSTLHSLEQCVQVFKRKSSMATYYSRVQGSYPEFFNRCPLIDHLNMCIAKSLGVHCEKKFSSYINKLWKIHIAPFLKLHGCDAKLNKIDAGTESAADKGCDELELCLKPLHTLGLTFEVPDEKLHNKICQINNGLQSCYEEKKHKCLDTFRSAFMFSEVKKADYLCSAQGKKGHKQIVNSKCVTDKTAALAAQEALLECADHYQLELEIVRFKALSVEKAVNACLILDRHMRCYTVELKRHCGISYAYYAKTLWHIANAPSAKEFGCDKPISEQCLAVTECKTPLHKAGLMDTFDGTMLVLNDEKKYNALCQLKKEFEPCYSSKENVCQDSELLISMVRVTQVLDYLCSDKVNQRVKKFANSSCASNQTLHQFIQSGLQVCVMNYELDLIVAQHHAEQYGAEAKSVNVCMFIKRLRDCVTAALMYHCESHFVSTARNIWFIYYMEIMLTYNCAENPCEDLKKCRELLNNGSCSYMNSLNFFPPEMQPVNFNRLCQSNNKFQSCYADMKTECDDKRVVTMVSSSADIIQHLCLYKGNEVLKEIADSPCLTSSTNLQQAEETVEKCIQSFQCELQKMKLFKAESIAQIRYQCLLQNAVYDCANVALTKQCGKDFASLVIQMWARDLQFFKGRIECGWVFNKKDEDKSYMPLKINNLHATKDQEGCLELERCKLLLKQYFNPETGYVELFSRLSDEETYSEFCQDNHYIKSCYAKNKDACNKNDLFISSALCILDYLCSSKGKTDFQKINDSQCVRSPIAILLADKHVGQCEKGSGFGLRTAYDKDLAASYDCLKAKKEKHCIKCALAHYCGKDYSLFVMRIVEMYIKPLAKQKGCA